MGITLPFVQENHSFSKDNVLRGMHFQFEYPQGKLIRVLSGKVFDVAVDLRRSSPSFGLHSSIILDSSEDKVLWIPPGYAHGFLVLSGPVNLTYAVTAYDNPLFEHTLLWSDPELMINWPLQNGTPILSDKDEKGVVFQKCVYYQ